MTISCSTKPKRENLSSLLTNCFLFFQRIIVDLFYRTKNTKFAIVVDCFLFFRIIFDLFFQTKKDVKDFVDQCFIGIKPPPSLSVLVVATKANNFCFLVGLACKLDATSKAGATDNSLFIFQGKERDDEEEDEYY